MGYSPGVFVKIGRFGTLRNSPQIFTSNPESSCKSICKHIWDVSGSLERCPALSPGFLAQIRPISGPSKFTPNLNKYSPKYLATICNHIGGVWGSLERFPALTQISTSLKPWAIAQAFFPKIGRFRTLPNSHQILTSIPESSWQSICEHIEGVLGSLERFPALTQIRHFQNHGL